MRKTLVLCLLIVPFFLLSEDEEFSYSYLGLSYNDGDSKGATLEGSLWLPAGFYLSGSAERSDYQIKGSEYEKNSKNIPLTIIEAISLHVLRLDYGAETHTRTPHTHLSFL